MRTTIDLDPDVDARVRALAHERGVSIRTVINDELRRTTHPAAEEAYVLPTFPMGVRPGVDLDRALRLATDLEDTETLRKLELRK